MLSRGIPNIEVCENKQMSPIFYSKVREYTRLQIFLGIYLFLLYSVVYILLINC